MPKKGWRKGKGVAKPADEAVNELVSVAGVDTEHPANKAALGDDPYAKIAALERELQAERAKRTDAEQQALRLAESQGMALQREIQEVPTGEYRQVERFSHFEVKGYKDDGREILKPVFKKVRVETFFYKIDLPPIGGMGLRTNGVDYLHGGVYKFDVGQLRDMKERVWRCWDHDRNVHGTDENVFRRDPRTGQSRNFYAR